MNTFASKVGNSVKFKIEATEGAARTGLLETAHGIIHTPQFMPVGTQASVKGVGQKELKQTIGAQIILANTYHLYLRPGLDLIQKAGGVHGFMNWSGPLLSDSGGYQVYSLADNRKITEEGVTFQSHIDGSRHLFTPENVVDIQRIIGADIIMAFDECPPYPSEKRYASQSWDLTYRWLKRCVKQFKQTKPKYGYRQALFPIVQGGVFRDLRKRSAEQIAKLDMPGNAIGGLSVGEPSHMMYEMTSLCCQILPATKPRYLMGVGTPVNLLESIALGIDMFDCVIPTRNGRNGMLYTENGIINIRNKKWERDLSPVDPKGSATYDKFYSKAYLRHLLLSNEMLGPQIASIHNLTFYLRLMKQARLHIQRGDFETWKNKMIPKLEKRL